MNENCFWHPPLDQVIQVALQLFIFWHAVDPVKLQLEFGQQLPSSLQRVQVVFQLNRRVRQHGHVQLGMKISLDLFYVS